MIPTGQNVDNYSDSASPSLPLARRANTYMRLPIANGSGGRVYGLLAGRRFVVSGSRCKDVIAPPARADVAVKQCAASVGDAGGSSGESE